MLKKPKFNLHSIISALIAFIRYLINLLEDLLDSGPNNKGYEAHFTPKHKILSSFNKGFSLNGKYCITELQSHKHALILGSSGTGKSTVILIPNIFKMANFRYSFCIHDPSGEIYEKTAGFLEMIGYEIKTLKFSSPEQSNKYNPLQHIQNSSDCYKIATTLVQNSMGKTNLDSFWNMQATSLIALIISVIHKQNAESANLSTVKHLIDEFLVHPEQLDTLVAGTNDAQIIREYKSFLTTEKKVLANIISTCRSALMMFQDEHISAVTEMDTIGFSEFRNKPVALFIMTNTSELNYYRPLSSLFFLQFFNHILNQPVPDSSARSIFFLMDELSSIYLPDTLQLALSNLRKYRCGILGIIQDHNQLEHLYGKNEAYSLVSNCWSKVYFPGQPIETAKELESTMGKKEYEDENGKKHIRHLLLADEIKYLDPHHVLVFCGNNRPMYVKIKPYYENSTYRKYAKIRRSDLQ